MLNKIMRKFATQRNLGTSPKRHEKVTMNRRLELLIATAAIVVGGAMYVLFRSEGMLLFRLTDAMGLNGVVGSMREAVAGWRPEGFVLKSLPGGLWALSYMLLMDVLFAGSKAGVRLAWASVVPLAGGASELMQLAGWLPGWFSVGDLMSYLVPLGVYALWCWTGSMRKRPHNTRTQHREPSHTLCATRIQIT